MAFRILVYYAVLIVISALDGIVSTVITDSISNLFGVVYMTVREVLYNAVALVPVAVSCVVLAKIAYTVA
jgi:hypothetical protein